MRFDMIKYDGTLVTLRRREQSGADTNKNERESTNNPKPEFKRAFTAFLRHVLDVAPFLADLRADIDVHTVHLKLDKASGRRTLQVAVNIPLAACSNKPITFTTPYMVEAPSDHDGDPQGFLSAATLKLMDEIQKLATAFFKGDHLGQVELMDIEAPKDEANGNGHTNGNRKHAKAKRGGEPTRIDRVLSKRDRDEVEV